MANDLVSPATPSFEITARNAPSFLPAEIDDPLLLQITSKVWNDEPPLNLDGIDPRQWDWRDHGITALVQDQSGWAACLSCATVSMIEARRQIAGRPKNPLSPGFIHNCLLGITNPDFSASYPKLMNFVKASGVAVSNDRGFPASDQTCQLDHRVSIASHKWCSGIGVVLSELCENGPLIVLIGFNAKLINHQGWDILDIMDDDPATPSHALLLLGYDLDRDFAIVQNSMGSDWGVNGIGRIRIGSGLLLTGRSGISAVI